MDSKEPKETFDIKTPSDMLEKLVREFERLSRSTIHPQDVVDHTINCAMTAWHLVEWAWKAHFVNDPKAQAQLASEIGFQPGAPKYDSRYPARWFARAMMKSCPALGHCRSIAIGSKHVYCVKTTVADTYVSEGPTYRFILDASQLGSGVVLDGPDIPSTQYIPKIKTDEGEVVNAIQVIDATTLFWQEFLKNYAIE